MRWAAHDVAHYWGEPLQNYQLAYQRLDQRGLDSAKALADQGEPSDDPDKWVPEATEVEHLAVSAVTELRRELAKSP